MKDVFFDNNSTTQVDPRVLKGFNRVIRTLYANPSTSYDNGVQSRCMVESCRKYTAEAMGAASQDQIYFCSGATEANNLCIRGVVGMHKYPHVIMTSIEHASVYNTILDLVNKGSCTMSECRVDPVTAKVDENHLRQLLTQHKRRTCLVTVIVGHNELGVIQDIQRISQLCHDLVPGVVVHGDITQLVGKYPIHLTKSGIDTASWSAHKYHGIRGCGGIYIRDKTLVRPCLTGGGQERSMRSSTESTALIYAMTEAMRCMLERHTVIKKHVTFMRDMIEKGIRRLFPDCQINCPGKDNHRLYNTLSVSIPHLQNSLVTTILNEKRIYINVGSACNKDSVSRTLSAIKLSPDLQRGTLRISLSHMNTLDECRVFLAIMHKVSKGQSSLPPKSRKQKCKVSFPTICARGAF